MAVGKSGRRPMVKCLLSFILMFSILSSQSWANSDDTKELLKLQKEYGYELYQVPFFIRFAYNKRYNKLWSDSYFFERKSFLIDYETQEAAEQRQDKIDAKIEADKEKEHLAEKKAEIQKLKDRIKARIEKEKAEKDEDADRQKVFNESIKQQKQELHDLEQEAMQGRM